MRVKCFIQEHNSVSRPRLELGSLDLESITLTIRPLRLPLLLNIDYFFNVGAGSRLLRPVVMFVQGKVDAVNEALYPSL